MTDDAQPPPPRDDLLDLLLETMEELGIDLSDPDTLESTIPEAVEAILPETNQVLLRALEQRAPSMWCDRRSLRSSFEARLRATWSEPLDLLHMLIAVCYEIGEEINREGREPGDVQGEHLFEALTRLHGRGCQIASEILRLLETGYGSGAFSRWRTLHELAVVGAFLLEQGEDTAERYLLHNTVDSWWGARQYGRFHEKLGLDPVDPVTMKVLEEAKDELCERFGKPFAGRHGWAAEAVGKNSPTFADIEEAVEMNHMRPFYRLASHSVHAGPKSLYFDLGLGPKGASVILAGPSNTGLADAGQACALSLVQITGALAVHRPKLDYLIAIGAMERLSDRVGESFIQVQQKVESLPEGSRGLRYWAGGLVHHGRKLVCRIRRALLGR